jgi:dipeptidyl aminopeptidase/acylaminoacyl peptidase
VEELVNKTTLIPRAALFGNPERISVKLSPDGAFMSYLAPDDGYLNVFVGPRGDPSEAVPVTHDRVRGVRQYTWAMDSRHLLYMQDEGGDENWSVYSVNVGSGESRNLTPFEGVAAHVSDQSHLHPSKVVLSINNRDPQLHDLYLADVATGELKLLEENTAGFAGYRCDTQLRPRIATRMDEQGGEEVFRKDGEEWTRLSYIPSDDGLTTQPFFFKDDLGDMFWSDSRGRNTGALVRYNIDTEEMVVVAEDSRADVSDILHQPIRRTPEAVAFTYDRKRWEVLDESVRADLEYLSTVADGEVEVVSRTDADNWWIVAYLLDDGPVQYYIYDRNAGHARHLFSSRPVLDGQPLVKMHPEVVTARDGLQMVCYLSLPLKSTPNGGSRPESPMPMVMYVHGGPWARDHWGYEPYHQLLANRGYAVLSVNYRTSTGFGKAFANAGILEWGRNMQHDLTDSVNWAIREGIADPDRVAIMGGSYGGYATLAGLTLTPTLYACGVDIVGPSNLITLLETVPPYWVPVLNTFRTRMGDERTEEGRALLTERSPLTHVDQIRRPLLIGQGANDPRVKQSESDQIIEAMTDRGIPVTYVLFPDEGHGFARPENRMAFTAVTEAFLAANLGGKAEPIGDAFTGSSITVPVGVGDVAGVSNALAT